MLLPQRALVSEDEFLALPESTAKVELLDGEVIVAPSPTYWHQEILQRIVFALRQWSENQTQVPTVGQAPLDVRFEANRILQPDAFVLLDRVSPQHEGPIDRVPDICIEVLSGERVYDRVTKRIIYATSGVREYWLVEPAGVVERWSGDNLASVEEVRDRLTTPILSDFELDLKNLFRMD